jgi:quinol monooxygenase YgiN
MNDSNEIWRTSTMSLTVHLYYTGTHGSARRFAEEMESSGIAQSIRDEDGNECYRYFQPLDDPETILLIDRWRDQASLDVHHASHMMEQLAALREKYDLHMQVERLTDIEEAAGDERFLRK